MQALSPAHLSVIIPTCDRPAELRLCLAALGEAQSRVSPFPVECLVVDNGSAESAADVSAIADACPFPVTLLRIARHAGSATARNAGARSAMGDILLFVDDDVCVHPDSLAGVVSAFRRDPGLGALLGRYDDAPGAAGFVSQFRNLLHAYTHHASAGSVSTFWTGFGAVRAGHFREQGGFLEEPCAIDDVEFGTRLAASGARIELHSNLQVKHLKRWTLRSMVRTDLVLRGVPWTLLIWRQRTMPNTLNVRYRERFSVAAVFLSVLLTGLSPAAHKPWQFPCLGLLFPVLLNIKFYRFLHDRRGSWFAARAAGLHCLYLLTAGCSFCAGTALYVWSLRRDRVSAANSETGIAGALRGGLLAKDGDA